MQIILSISQAKRNRKKYNITFSSGFVCSLMDEVIVKNQLRVGKEVEEEKITELIEESDTVEGFSRALKTLERTMKTEKEMRVLLLQKGFCEKAVEQVIKKLNEYAYIKDSEYAKLYASNACRTKGKRMVEFELKQKGISPTLIAKTMETHEGEIEAANKVAIKYMKNKVKTKETFAKLFRHLIGRGFESETVKTVVKQYGLEGEIENENWN